MQQPDKENITFLWRIMLHKSTISFRQISYIIFIDPNTNLCTYPATQWVLSTSTGTWPKKKKIKAWCSHQSELICNALPILLTSTEVMHSKNKEAIDDSTSYNGNKKLMHQNTTYITYFSLNKSSNSLIYCIGEFLAPLKSMNIRTKISFWCFPTNSKAWSWSKYTRWF